MIVYQNGAYTPEYLDQKARMDALYAARGATKPFVVGQAYLTNEGKTVTCIETTDLKGYECARFDDGETVPACNGVGTVTTGWRYNRDSDRGRCTGTAMDHSDPRCVIPESRDEDCAEGMHSWVDEVGKLPADTACDRCGELYGDPE